MHQERYADCGVQSGITLESVNAQYMVLEPIVQLVNLSCQIQPCTSD
jgi:hypothetical protein